MATYLLENEVFNGYSMAFFKIFHLRFFAQKLKSLFKKKGEKKD